MERIELGDFLVIAEIHSGIDAHQLAHMTRVIQLAEAALAAPFAGFGDFEVFPEPHAKAAVYCSRIVRYHPLPDGNKRTGYDVMREFVDRNGGHFSHPPGGLDETAQMIEDVTAEIVQEPEFINWMFDRVG